jgi:putative acetyltransferase
VNINFSVRSLIMADVPAILSIMREARREYGLEGRVASLLEPSDLALYQTYSFPRACYFVVVNSDLVVGGAGIAPLGEQAPSVCELQRMYLDPSFRRKGAGAALLDACIAGARERSFTHCYAETIAEMSGALKFYSKHGFQRLNAPYGNTGHSHNDCWLLRNL